MKIKDFFRKKWSIISKTVSGKLSAFTNSIHQKLSSVAERLDDNFSINYPITSRVLKKLGITSKSTLDAAGNGLELFGRHGKKLVVGLKDVGIGFWGVIGTFLPQPSSNPHLWIPKVMKAIWHPELRKDFFRGASRDVIFATLGIVLLEWPRLAHQFITKQLYKREDAHETGFYLLAFLNLYLVYRIIKFNTLFSKMKHFLYYDTLDTCVISDKASKLKYDSSVVALKKITDEGRFVFIDPRPESIKRIARTKIFSSLEAVVKDSIMLGILAFNHLIIGSRFIAIVGWLIRAKIIGKDLGLTLLASTGISNNILRRIQGHRNFHFLGEGVAFLALNDLGTSLFYKLTSLNNVPILSLPINFAISSFIYKFLIISTYMKEINLREDECIREGINLDTFYRPFIVDPIIDRMAEKIEEKLLRKENNTEYSLSQETDTATLICQSYKIREGHFDSGYDKTRMEQSQFLKKNVNIKECRNESSNIKPAKNNFWTNLAKKKLSATEKAFLQLYADNFIFLLSALKQARNSGGDYFINFLSLFFPIKLQETIKCVVEELTDDKIEAIIVFLFRHQKSYLTAKKEPEASSDERWVFIKDRIPTKSNSQIFSQANSKVEMEGDNEDIELFDLPLNQMQIVDRAVASTLRCYKQDIIDFDELDEYGDPDKLLDAMIDSQYNHTNDPSIEEITSIPNNQIFSEKGPKVSHTMNHLQRFSESFSLPILEFLYNLKIIRDSESNNFRKISKTVLHTTTTIERAIEAKIPGGKSTLTAAAAGAPLLVSGPVAATISTAIVTAQTIADNQEGIKTTLNILNNVVDGLTKRNLPSVQDIVDNKKLEEPATELEASKNNATKKLNDSLVQPSYFTQFHNFLNNSVSIIPQTVESARSLSSNLFYLWNPNSTSSSRVPISATLNSQVSTTLAKTDPFSQP